jgi:hypothetical protein
VPEDPNKRDSLRLALATLALTGVGLLGEGVGLFLSRRQIQLADEANRLAAEEVAQGNASVEKGDWAIPDDFAIHLLTVNYASDPLKGYGGQINQGVNAIRDSMRAIRARELTLLPDIHVKLERAIRATTSDRGVCLALSRLAIDNSFAGDGDRALDALKRIDFGKVDDDQTLVRLLDFGTSVALNAIDPGDFQRLGSPTLTMLEPGWQRLGIDETDPKKIADLAPDFGVGIFAIAQRAAILGLQAASRTEQGVRRGRQRWFDLLKEVMRSVEAGTEISSYAEDFLYSLHRPAFHAAACCDHDMARSIIEYYFHGTNQSDDVESQIDVVRKEFADRLPGSSAWMFLLASTYEDKPLRARAMVERLATLSARQTPQFKKALVHNGARLGIPRRHLLDALKTTSAKIEAFPTTIHRVYMAQSEIAKH